MEIIFYSIRNKHPDWSKKIITVCTRYTYKRRYQKNRLIVFFGWGVMQKVKVYQSIYEAENDMSRYINEGWRVHTCAMTSYRCWYSIEKPVLVVYEKE